LAAVVLATATPAAAYDIDGIILGMPMEQAKTKLAAEGAVTERRASPRATTLETGRYTVIACDGRVRSVLHDLGWDFTFFASLTQWAQKAYGQPSETNAQSSPGSFSAIYLRWLTPTETYTVSYTQAARGQMGSSHEALTGRREDDCLNTE